MDSLIQNNSLSINGVNQYKFIHDDVLLWACAGCADAEVMTPPHKGLGAWRSRCIDWGTVYGFTYVSTQTDPGSVNCN